MREGSSRFWGERWLKEEESEGSLMSGLLFAHMMGQDGG